MAEPPEGHRDFANSEFLVSPEGQVVDRYDKVLLLPFNEYLPLEGKVRWPSWITTLETGFRPGRQYTLFDVEGIPFGAPICWENLFAGHFRRFVQEGARFMVSATNEGFFGPTGAPYQTFAMNVFRAVENRVAVVRAASTGVSAFIEPDGRVAERVSGGEGRDLFVSGTLVRDVPLSEGKTFYTRHGDIFSVGAAAFAAGFLFFAATGGRRRGGSP
jgi:apolipoprotein N-acyltransferase